MIRFGLAGRLYRRSVDEKLDAGDNYFLAWLQSALNRVIVSDGVAQRHRTLLSHRASVNIRGHINEGLSADTRDRQYGNGRRRVGAPDHSRLYQLLGAKAIQSFMDWRLCQNTL